MLANELLKYSILSAEMILETYLSDFSDDEMLVSPVEAANSASWQMGHLCFSIHQCLSGMGVTELPELNPVILRFSSKEFKDCAELKDLTRVTLVNTLKDLVATLVNFASKLREEEYYKPAPSEMQAYAKTIGEALMAQATHITMHAGQIAVIRRKLSKQVLI